MRIIWYSSDYYDGTIRSVIEGDNGEEYTTNINPIRDISWCSCPSWVYDVTRECKHIRFLRDNIDMVKEKKNAEENNNVVLEGLKCKCDTINDLLSTRGLDVDGGFQIGTQTSVIGQPKQGKTQLVLDVALFAIQKGMKAVYIETEGYRQQDTLSTLEKKGSYLGIDRETIEKNFIFIDAMSDFKEQALFKIGKLFGYHIYVAEKEIKTTKEGKVISGGKKTLKYDDVDAELTDDIMNGVGVVIIDSLTHPIKETIGHDTENLTARSGFYDRMFAKFYQFARYYNIVMIVIQHTTVQPVMPGGAKDLGKQYGGDSPQYNAKFAVQIVDGTNALRKQFGHDGVKRVRLWCHPNKITPSRWYPVILDEDGVYIDAK